MILSHFGGKDWKSYESGKIGSSKSFRATSVEKVVNQAKLSIANDSELLCWGKIGKVTNQVKLAVPSDSEPLQWEKIGKVANQVKLAIPNDSELLQWEKIGKVEIGCSKCEKPKFFTDPNSNFALPLTKIAHNMNAIDILVKQKYDPVGTVVITNDLHCQKVKKRIVHIV